MSIEVKPGRWRLQNGRVLEVVENSNSTAWPWRGRGEYGEGLIWSQYGMFGAVQGPLDLAEYLGPLPDTTPAPKRYWLFAGDEHYATGGVHDRQGMYDTIAEAVADGKRQQIAEWSDRLWDLYEWWHVVDITTGEIVAGSAEQAYGAPDLTPEQIGGEA